MEQELPHIRLAKILTTQLKMQIAVAGNGRVARKAIGYIYGYTYVALIKANLYKEGNDEHKILPQTLWIVLESLFPKNGERYINIIYTDGYLKSDGFSSGTLEGITEYVEWIDHSQAKFGLAKIILDEKDALEGTPIDQISFFTKSNNSKSAEGPIKNIGIPIEAALSQKTFPVKAGTEQPRDYAAEIREGIINDLEARAVSDNWDQPSDKLDGVSQVVRACAQHMRLNGKLISREQVIYISSNASVNSSREDAILVFKKAITIHDEENALKHNSVTKIDTQEESIADEVIATPEDRRRYQYGKDAYSASMIMNGLIIGSCIVIPFNIHGFFLGVLYCGIAGFCSGIASLIRLSSSRSGIILPENTSLSRGVMMFMIFPMSGIYISLGMGIITCGIGAIIRNM